MDEQAQKEPSVVDELMVEVEEAADEEVGEQNFGVAMELVERLEGAAAKLRASLKTVTAKELATLDEAREIMGAEFLGTEAVKKTWGREFKDGEVPAIPFSKEDLERAKELGQFLVLGVEKTGIGKAASMSEQSAHLKDRFAKEGRGNVLVDEKGWKEHEEFFTEDTPRLGWRLVTKEVIPGSLGKNAVARTRVLADYVRNVVFKGQEVPAEATEAIAEFEAMEAEITGLMDTDWQECNRRLARLKLNQMFRRLPVEGLADCQVHFDNTGERLLPDTYDQTTRLSSDGSMVLIGYAASAGADVGFWDPISAGPLVGVVFSRSR